MTTGPISGPSNPEASALDQNIQAIIDAAKNGRVDTRAIFDAQGHIQNLLNDPNISPEMKKHLQALMADFKGDPSKINMNDIFNVQQDIHNLP